MSSLMVVVSCLGGFDDMCLECSSGPPGRDCGGGPSPCMSRSLLKAVIRFNRLQPCYTSVTSPGSEVHRKGRCATIFGQNAAGKFQQQSVLMNRI